MKILKAGVIYSLMVFAVGFVPGTIPTLWLVPRVGVRTAELLEMPMMLLVTIFAAAWIIRHFKLSSRIFSAIRGWRDRVVSYVEL